MVPHGNMYTFLIPEAAAQAVAADGCQFPVRDRGMEVATIGPVLCGVALIFLTIRVLVRIVGNRELFGWDDGIIIVAWLAGVPLAVFDVYFYLNGLGKDIWRVSFDQLDRMLMFFYYGEVAYLMATVLVKIALLLFFLRIFPSRTFQRIVWGMIGIIIAFCIAFLGALVFQCWPINYSWLRWDGEHEGKCVNVYVGGFSHAAINMVLDIIIVVLPMPLLYKLQFTYSWRQKSHIFIMFSFGIIVTVVCILRLNTLAKFGNSKNVTWDYTDAAIWSVVEVQVAVICACLPACKVFFAKLIPSWFARTTKGSKPSAGYLQDKSNSSPNAQRKNTISKRTSITISSMPLKGAQSGFTELVDLERRRTNDDMIIPDTPPLPSPTDPSERRGSGDYSAPLSSTTLRCPRCDVKITR